MRFLSMVLQVCVFAGVVLAFAAVTAYGEATVATDKENYQAGETVYITGTGWTPGETVSLRIYEDSVQTLRATLYAFADTTGNIANGEFVIEEGDSNTVFRLAAEGLTSGAVAETTFFDGYYVRWVTVGSQTPSPVQAGSSATYTVTVGGYRWCWWGGCYCYSQYTNLTITTSLPPGVTYSFNPSVVLPGGSNCTATSTLTITTSGGTPPNDFFSGQSYKRL